MAIRPNFSIEDVQDRFDNLLNVVENRAILRLQRLGDMCVNHARDIPPETGFSDQTGNLRSSIGYVVFKDGVAIHENYQIVKNGNEGVVTGKNLALQVGANKSGYALVVTAGMNYAVKVEARGRDVLTSAEVMAKTELPRMLNELKVNIQKALS